LVDLFGVVAGVVLGNAGALLGRIVDFLRTGRKASREEHQAEQASQSHGTLSLRERIGLVAPDRAKTARQITIGRHDGSVKNVFKLSARAPRLDIIGGLDARTSLTHSMIT
jgi:hypothetical protein